MSNTRAWVIRLVTLTLFNVAVLALIVWLLPGVRGKTFGILWGAVLLTAATIWIKPALMSVARRQVGKGAAQRSAGTQRWFASLAVFVVAFVIWLLMIWLTDLRVVGWFWGYLLPPIALLIAWWLYDVVDDQLEKTVGNAYDSASGAIAAKRRGRTQDPTAR